MAEREGFEPPERANAQRFSRPPLSTTQPPLRTSPFIRGAATKFKRLGWFFYAAPAGGAEPALARIFLKNLVASVEALGATGLHFHKPLWSGGH